MKPFTMHHSFGRLLLFALVGVAATISVSGENTLKVAPAAPAESLLEAFDIPGTVIDVTGDISEETLAKLERAASLVEFQKSFEGMLEPRVVPNAVVTLRGDSVQQQVVTDSEGNFRFVGFPEGEYELSAEAPARPPLKGMARGKMRIRFVPSSRKEPKVEIHTYSVTVRGRITTADGQPVAGAKVTGTPVPFREAGFPNTVSTMSNADGSYELLGFVPPNIYRIAGYLMGGDPLEGGDSSAPFYAEIRVEADGFMQNNLNVPRVPLVSEAFLVPARRLKEIMFQMAARSNVEERELQEAREFQAKDVPFGQGNTITGMDIVLEKIADDAR